MPTVRLVALWLLAVAPALAAPVPPPVKTAAEKLVGTWRLVKSSNPPAGKVDLTVEFAGDGTMTIRQKNGDAEADVYAGKFKVDGDKITYTVKVPGGGEKTEPLTIKTLSDDELVVVDPDDVKEEFKREKVKH
jgi:uncharacterized protein (TIGR03066 family)